MAYSIERADLLTEQLGRFAHAPTHQLVGQLANLSFWLQEAVDALRVLDEYPQRFRALRAAQVAWVAGHGTQTSYCPQCGGACELGARTPEPPRRTSSEDIDGARQALRRATYRFLLRCHRVDLLPEPDLRAACAPLGVTVEPEDLEFADGAR